jgi:helicase MOV-10
MPTNEREFKRGKVFEVYIYVLTEYRGRFTDRMDLTFLNTWSAKKFMISRDISVHIVNKEDHEALKPAQPYTPIARVPRQPVTKIIEGELPPALDAIPYETILHKEPIPQYLHDILAAKHPIRKALEEIRGIYVSADLSMRTYVERFRNLLWIEEYQLE